MTHEKFKKLYYDTINLSEDIMLAKSNEYTPESDALHNFKQAAELQGVKPITALMGMKAKHDISLYDMVRDTENGKTFGIAKWDEKIIDNINYLILLRALLCENMQEYNR